MKCTQQFEIEKKQRILCEVHRCSDDFDPDECEGQNYIYKDGQWVQVTFGASSSASIDGSSTDSTVSNAAIVFFRCSTAALTTE